MIEIKSLTKKFDEVIAVNNLNLTIEKGITGLVGHNGAGKSTLFRLIASVYKADSGCILVDGVDSRTVEAKRKIFFLSDDPYVKLHATCEQTLKFYEAFFEFDREKFFELLNKFELPQNRNVSAFSKGMKRQLFIALALSSKCSILLMDEMFDGLDPLVLEVIKDEIIKCASEDKIIVASSHNVTTLERLCDKFIILNKGKLGKKMESEDIGNNFAKYQALFPKEITQEQLEELGYEVVSFKKIGSIYNFVIAGENNISAIKEELKPTLIEQIGIDSSEIIALEMLVAKKKGEK